MERARATWTDERLDDLSRRVDDGFNRVDEDLRAMRAELSARIDAQGAELGARIDAQGAESSRRFDRLDVRIDALQRMMIQVGGAMTVAILATLLSVVATRG
ncbi:MAG: hypothetical protein ACRDK9_11235 [Solirubrobacterales bacterium]